jgi:MFS family permease
VANPHTAERDWSRTGVKLLVGVVLLFLLAFLSAAFLPRWWSHRIGHQVDDSIARGIILGLFYGFVFTLLPLLTLRWTFRKRRPWKTWGILCAVALVLAAPNLLTLGIVIGSGNGAHAGERTLDVDAPGFRGSVLAGAIAAALATVVGEYLIRSRRRSRRDLDRLREQVRMQNNGTEKPEAPPGAPPTPGGTERSGQEGANK